MNGSRSSLSNCLMAWLRRLRFLSRALPCALMLGGAPLAARDWIVALRPGADPEAVAEQSGWSYLGPVEGVAHLHRFAPATTHQMRALSASSEAFPGEALPEVAWAQPDQIRDLVPHGLPRWRDPFVRDQWYLRNTGRGGGERGVDLHVESVWKAGITGQGVRVAFLDGGIAYNHPDLAANYTGWGFNPAFFGTPSTGANADDPAPVFNLQQARSDAHGTPTVGIVHARANNGMGGTGVAPDAQFAAVRLLYEAVPDSATAQALAFRQSQIDIYNNSWGPDEASGYVESDALGPAVRTALAQGVSTGRGGKGCIYVFSAGNGGDYVDSMGDPSPFRASYNGYANTREVIAVGAHDNRGAMIAYSSPGPCVMVSAPSTANISSFDVPDGAQAGIWSLDAPGNLGYVPGDGYFGFGGTSASAPMVSGVVALMLQAAPQLTWRDVQHILIDSAVPFDLGDSSWAFNGSGRRHSDKAGFGRVDAEAAVRLARAWPGVAPAQTVVQSRAFSTSIGWYSPTYQTFVVPENLRVEHVVLEVELNSASEPGVTDIWLTSPSGTTSDFVRANEVIYDEPFYRGMTLKNWGELSAGTWSVGFYNQNNNVPTLRRLKLTIYGTPVAANRPPAGASRGLNVPGTLAVAFDPLSGVTDPDGDQPRLLSLSGSSRGDLEVRSDRQVVYRARSPIAFSETTETLFALITDGKGGVLKRRIDLSLPVLRPPVATGFTEGVVTPPLSLGGNITSLTALEPGNTATVAQGGGSFTYQPRRRGWSVGRLSYVLAGDAGQGRLSFFSDRFGDFALSFADEDAVVTATAKSSFDLTGAFTIEAWVRPTAYGEDFRYMPAVLSSSEANWSNVGYGRIFDKGNVKLFASGYDAGLYQNQSLVLYCVNNSAAAEGGLTNASSAAGSLPLDEWTHVAVSYDPGSSDRVRFWINGVLSPTTYDKTGSPAFVESSASVDASIGNSPERDRGFVGDIAEVRVWNVARTTTAIVADKDRQLSGFEPGLLAWWDFSRPRLTSFTTQGLVALPTTIDRAYQVPAAGPWRPFEDALGLDDEDLNGTWSGESSWAADRLPLVSHATWGTMEWIGADVSGIYFRHLNPALGTLFTSREAFPWVFSDAQRAWVYLTPAQGEPGWAYRVGSTGSGWFRVP